MPKPVAVASVTTAQSAGVPANTPSVKLPVPALARFKYSVVPLLLFGVPMMFVTSDVPVVEPVSTKLMTLEVPIAKVMPPTVCDTVVFGALPKIVSVPPLSVSGCLGRTLSEAVSLICSVPPPTVSVPT